VVVVVDPANCRVHHHHGSAARRSAMHWPVMAPGRVPARHLRVHDAAVVL